MAQRSINNRYDLLVIGGSAGSLDAIIQLLPVLRRDLQIAIVIVLHRKAGESFLAELLNDKTNRNVKEAEEKESIENGTVYIAPPDYHLLIEKDKTFSLDYSEKIHFSRPAIDATFETAADVYQSSVAAILLSGANADGADGLKKIKECGGLTIVQNPAEAPVSYMPQQAIDRLEVDYISTVQQMIQIINHLNL